MRNKNILAYYRDKRVLSVFILGVSSGLPWVLIGSVLTLWLKESGVSRTQIGYSGLIFTVYAVNFLWSPLLDRFSIPFLSHFLDKRQSWIVPCQLSIGALCCVMFLLSPQDSPKAVIFIGLLIALCSATQDIAIDAYRIDSFSKGETQLSAAAAGAATAGWWSGYAGLGFIPLFLSDYGWKWQQLYLLLASLPLCIGVLTCILPAPKHSHPPQEETQLKRYRNLATGLPFHNKLLLCGLVFSPITLAMWAFIGSPGITQTLSDSTAYVPFLIIVGLALATISAITLTQLLRSTLPATQSKATSFDVIFARVLVSICEPIQDFFTRNGFKLALQILMFIFLFKIGEAFLGKMSIVFYKEIGYSNTDIATYSKMLTWWVTVISALFAGVLTAKFGLIKGLFFSGIAMACSNLMFAWIAMSGPSIPLYIATIIVDGVAASWSLVAFVAFISALCNHSFSASQYALLASLGALGRTTLSSLSGQIVDYLEGNWAIFFLITTLMVIPSLILLLHLAKHPNLQLGNTVPKTN